ncbi:hypothetical protein HID58_070793 [Brassica napus]|uniref:Replication protein A 70 kDa DNA-binding subunit B/D first OB fold domain-containing protein n=1 Tax=Brassica napus TaxID=3708 RepID=A0ABQ7YZR4_BRANA|nr:hypothetical protein HID58_070793 [Brassica napus]
MDTIFNINSLSDVSPIKFAWSILVKLLHTWISSCHQFGSSLEMVLTDINVRKYNVIGEVLDFRCQNIVKFGRKEMTKVEFNLRDIKNQRIQCCITGKSAEIFSQKVKQSNSGDICLIRFARAFNYQGEWKVTNAFDSSLVLINPDIKEAKALKQK